MWKLHPDFQAGQYRKVADELLTPATKAGKQARKQYVASLVAALSFLGRMEEASDLFDLEAKASKQSLDRVAARFFLAIGWVRRSEYEKARAHFLENEKSAGASPLESFFVHQGKTFFLYYTGRLLECLSEAALSRRAAIASANLFARCLATDALGHAQVKAGEINLGLDHLAEAEKLAGRLGNKSLASAISISRELYSFEFGLGRNSVDRLEGLWEKGGPENNYSQSNVALELARQLTLRGQYARAARVLENTAPSIYSSQNRRQEIQLNLRLSELAGRRGAFFEAHHFLWFCRRLINREVDGSLELMALGIELKLSQAEGKKEEEARLTERIRHLGENFPSTRNRNLQCRLGQLAPNEENPEDKVHLCLKAAREGKLEDRLEAVLKKGFFAEASLILKLNPSAKGIALLPGNLGCLVQSPEQIEWRTPLSSLQQKLLRMIAGRSRETTKEEMVKTVWGYRYEALRHDSMVYAALSSLRKAMGAAGAWLQPTEAGYRFQADLWLPANAPAPAQEIAASTVPEHLLASLNHRQIEILEWLRTTRFISVKDCQERFHSSEITALRDLSSLLKQGVVIRTGKARATRYSLAAVGEPS
jgi:DNA-binding winged helix-turn-helix (wHTH) protein